MTEQRTLTPFGIDKIDALIAEFPFMEFLLEVESVTNLTHAYGWEANFEFDSLGVERSGSWNDPQFWPGGGLGQHCHNCVFLLMNDGSRHLLKSLNFDDQALLRTLCGMRSHQLDQISHLVRLMYNWGQYKVIIEAYATNGQLADWVSRLRY